MPTVRGEQRRGTARREAILAAGADLMLGSGMKAVTHRAVAEAAGVPHGAIRYYFQSREALLLACVGQVERERAAEADAVLAEALRLDGYPGSERTARLLLRCYFGPRLDDASLRGAIGWLSDSSRESPALATTLTSQRGPIDDQLGRLLTLCGYPDAPVRLVGAVMDGAVMTAVIEGVSQVADAAVAITSDLLCLLDGGQAAR